MDSSEEHCKIPRALANDNFYGFADETILQYGARWIEMAAASPILNCIICYYVEGDRGHLMDEKGMQRSNPINVRGNAYSFAMPWESIASKLRDVVDGKVDWMVLPQPAEILAKSVLFNLRIGNVFDPASPYRRTWKSVKNIRAPAPLAFSISVFSSLVPAPDFCAATLVPSYSFAPTSNTSRALTINLVNLFEIHFKV